MTSPPRVLIATMLLLAGTAARGGPERDYNEPPPGAAPVDAKLWRELREGTGSALWQISRLVQCSSRLQYGKYYEALDAAARLAAPAEATRARALHDALTAAAEGVQKAVPADGGRVHPCRRTLLDFEQRIDPKNVEVANELPEFRVEARKCADRMNAIVAAARPAADALERALAEADAFLKRDAPTAPPATSRN